MITAIRPQTTPTAITQSATAPPPASPVAWAISGWPCATRIATADPAPATIEFAAQVQRLRLTATAATTAIATAATPNLE